MVGTHEAVVLAAAAAKMRDNAAPTQTTCVVHQSNRIMTAGTAFQPMKKHDQIRGISAPVQPVEINEVVIGCLPALATQLKVARRIEKAGVNTLQMPARQPP